MFQWRGSLTHLDLSGMVFPGTSLADTLHDLCGPVGTRHPCNPTIHVLNLSCTTCTMEDVRYQFCLVELS